MKSVYRAALPLLRSLKITYCYLLDALRYSRYSNSIGVNGTVRRLAANITYQYHVVEKGFCMPNRRWNFGHPKILALVADCHTFLDRYGSENEQLRCAVGVLKTYLDEHQTAGVEVPHQIRGSIERLAERLPDVTKVEQKKMSRDELFSHANSSFPEFAKSRASVRSYSTQSIPLSEIFAAVELAKTAPSACNRQATHVYVLSDRDSIDAVLAYQNGNKGFGHLADKALVLTADLSSFRGAQERNFGWMDSGIFAMNLLYSLHNRGIGACPLNAGISPTSEAKVRALCGIPPEEVVTLFVSCGYVPDVIDLAKSERKSIEEICHLVKRQ